MTSQAIQTTLLMTLLSLVVGGLLLALVVFVGDTSGLEDSRCKKSVEAYAQLLSLGSRSSERELALAKETIDCPYEELKPNARNANKEIADELASCFRNYGAGELNLYGKNEGTFCSVCAVVTPKADVLEFAEYLDNTIYVKEKKTYAEYLSGGSLNLESDITLKADERYGIFYVYVKGVDSVKSYQDNLAAYSKSAAIISIGVAGFALNPFAGALFIIGGAGHALVHASTYETPYETSAQVLLMPFDENVLTETLGCTRIPVEVLDG